MARKLLLEKAHVEGIRYFDTYRQEERLSPNVENLKISASRHRGGN